MLEAGPPVMQGHLSLVQPATSSGFASFARFWFELRGTLLVWSAQRDSELRVGVVDLREAIVATSRSLQRDPARTGADVGLVSAVPGGAKSFFSIRLGSTEHVVGADEDAEMRAWMSAILAQQGDKEGAAAVVTGRTSISSHEQPPSPAHLTRATVNIVRRSTDVYGRGLEVPRQ